MAGDLHGGPQSVLPCHVHALVQSSRYAWGGSSESLVMDRMLPKKGWDVPSKKRGGKTVASVLCAFACLLSPRGHSYWAVSSPVETPTLQGTGAAPPGHSHQAPDPSDETAVLADPLTAALGESQIHRIQ